MNDETKKQLGVVSQSMYILLQGMNDIKGVIDKLLRRVNSICPMHTLNCIGADDRFMYYIMEDEYISEYPHIHVCVESSARQWEGKVLQLGNEYKCIATVRLACIKSYTVDNLEFGLIADKKATNNSVKKRICNWLNSCNDGLFENSEPNYILAMKAYVKTNPNGMHNKEYIDFLKK